MVPALPYPGTWGYRRRGAARGRSERVPWPQDTRALADGRHEYIYMGQTMAQQAAPSQPGMPDMRVMAKIMPFFMLFFFNKFASGLSLYYFIANLITIGQVTTVKKFFIDEDKIREKIKAKQAEPKDEKKKSSFAERLEAMQKEQQKKADEMKRQRDQARKARNQKRKK